MAKGIYCCLDKENDKTVYVGKDSNIDKNKRYRHHLTPSAYNAQPINRILQNNPDRYIYQVLWEVDDCTDNHLNQMEIYYINEYKPQFNFTEGGDGISGFKHSKESKRKMSEAKKGENHPMYGKTHSEEARKKMSENNARYWHGKSHSEEARKKMSEVHNTTGFYRVYKKKDNHYKQGFIWRYQYSLGSKRKSITCIDLKKLEKIVRKEGLEWKVINKENSIKSIQENENNNNRFN